jgi:hypothetical protein
MPDQYQSMLKRPETPAPFRHLRDPEQSVRLVLACLLLRMPTNKPNSLFIST